MLKNSGLKVGSYYVIRSRLRQVQVYIKITDILKSKNKIVVSYTQNINGRSNCYTIHPDNLEDPVVEGDVECMEEVSILEGMVNVGV